MFFFKTYEPEIIEAYNRKRNNAKDRNLEFTITLENIKRIRQANACYYTGEKFNRKNYSMSIERIDSSKGYVPGNIIPVATVVNQIKSNFTIEEMKYKVEVELPNKIAICKENLKKCKKLSSEEERIARKIINFKKAIKTLNRVIKEKSEKNIDASGQINELNLVTKRLIELSTKNQSISVNIKSKKIENELEKHELNREIMIKIVEQLETNPKMGDDFMTFTQKIIRTKNNLFAKVALTLSTFTYTTNSAITN